MANDYFDPYEDPTYWQDWSAGGGNEWPSYTAAAAADTATNGFAEGFGMADPDIYSTFEGRPQELWRALRTAQMGRQAFIPQFQRTVGQGLTPAYGGYLMSGGRLGSGTFSDYLRKRLTGTTGAARRATDWTSAVGAARRTNPFYDVPTTAGGLTSQQLAIQGMLTDTPRAAIAMAQAAMGGGRGVMGQARERALSNLFDIYSAKATSAGRPQSDFLGYLSDIGIGTPVVG